MFKRTALILCVTVCLSLATTAFAQFDVSPPVSIDLLPPSGQTRVIPITVTSNQVVSEEKKLSDILIGYLNPADHVPSAAEVAAATEAAAAAAGKKKEEKNDDDDDEVDTGPDPVEAKKRFTASAASSNNR